MEDWYGAIESRWLFALKWRWMERKPVGEASPTDRDIHTSYRIALRCKLLSWQGSPILYGRIGLVTYEMEDR